MLINIENGNLIDKYISSFYYIIATMTTVGYGDITCVSSIERNFQIILLAIGTIIYSFIITKFGNYIGKQSNITIQLNNKKNILEQIRITHPLMPFKLYYKIHNYLVRESNKLQNNKNMEICTLVNSLPDKIRNELLRIIYKDVINNFKIFKDSKNSDFIIKMLTCFVQTTCKKDTILMIEGKKVENIIYVKDGRLILEATIDLLDPIKSIKKYFKENFKDIDLINKGKRNSIDTGEDEKEKIEGEGGEEINQNNLEKKLNYFIENNNKLISNRSVIFDINNENNESFQIGVNNNTLDDEQNSIISKNEENYHYLKIIDIRKNEYFGDIYMFLDRPSPLTLKVKSKIAEVFLLKKKDAININNIHHNIVNRIKMKSYKNLLSIRKKTKKIIVKYFNFNKFNNSKGVSLQDMSWFNEKSRSTNITNNITGTNISSIPRQKENKSNFSLFAKKGNDIKKGNYAKYSCINSSLKREITKVKKSDLKKCISTTTQKGENSTIILNKLKYKNLYNIQKPQNIKNEYIPINNKNIINNSSSDLNSIHSRNNLNISLDKKNNLNDIIYEKLSKFSKSKNSSQNNMNQLEITKKEEEIITLNKINPELDKAIRKKIKSKVRKEKIINLWKFQNEIINIKIDNEKTNDGTNQDIINILTGKNNMTDSQINNKDMNSFIFNKLLEYLTSESEEESVDIKRFNSINLKADNVICFDIKSSYYNLNNLTKGTIIKNQNIKKKLKGIIKQYINETKKNIYEVKNSENKINKLRNKLSKKSHKDPSKRFRKNNFSHKALKSRIIDIDNISSISSKTIKEPIDKASTNSKKYQKSSERLNAINDKNYITKMISNRIKQTINNNTDIYINFKKSVINNKFSNISLDNSNNLLKKFVITELLSKNKKNTKKSCRSSINLINKYKDDKKSNLGSSKSAKKKAKKGNISLNIKETK